MIAKRRQFSESQLSCEAMSETNKYSFETLLQHINPLRWIIPCCFDQSRPSYLVVVGLKGKAAKQQSHHHPATSSLPFRCFGRWSPEGLWDFGSEWTWKMFEFHNLIMINNKDLPWRLLEQCSTRPWCPAYPRFLISNETKKIMINDKKQRFPEKCSWQPRWSTIWSLSTTKAPELTLKTRHKERFAE